MAGLRERHVRPGVPAAREHGQTRDLAGEGEDFEHPGHNLSGLRQCGESFAILFSSGWRRGRLGHRLVQEAFEDVENSRYRAFMRYFLLA